MDCQTSYAILSSFLDKNASNPLNESKKQNLPCISHKKVEEVALKAIDRATSEPLVNGRIIETASLGFRGMYSMKKPTMVAISINKKHQVFIVKLIESKRYIEAVNELATLRHYIECILNESDFKWHNNLLVEISNGIEFNARVNELQERTQMVSLSISFHFLLLQSILHYISTNTRLIVFDMDNLWNKKLIYGCAQSLLPSSNFSAWLALSDPENIPKYNRNLLKLIKGYHSVISAVNKKAKDYDLGILASCFHLKVLEYQGITDIESLPQVGPDERCIPFIHDLKMRHPEIAPLLMNMKRESKNVDEVINSLSLFTNDFDEKHLTSIGHISDELKLRLSQHDKFLRLVKKLEFSNSSISHCLVGFLLHVFSPPNFENAKPNISHLQIFDKITVFVKTLISDNTKGILVEQTLSFLAKIMTDMKDWRRLRNISNLYFNYGNKVKDKNMWVRSSDLELVLYKSSKQAENINHLRNKFHKASTLLFDAGHFRESLSLSTKYFETINDKEEFIGPLSSKGKDFNEEKLLNIMLKCMQNVDDLAALANLNRLPETFKLTLILKSFDIIDFSVDPNEKSKVLKKLISNLLIESENAQGLICYKYLRLRSGLKSVDTKQFDKTVHPVLSCGINFEKFLSTDDHSSFSSCIERFNFLIDNPDVPYFADIENEIIKDVVDYLNYNESNGLVLTLIQKYLENRGVADTNTRIVMQMKLCDILMKMGLVEDSVVKIKELVESFKTYRINSVYLVAKLSLVQLEFHICNKSVKPAIEKFYKVLNLLKGKDEYTLKSEKHLDINQKFKNLLLVSKLQILSSRLNLLMENSRDSFVNIKMAIKLLYSIVKKAGNHTSSQVHLNIKWETESMLNDSYKIIISLLLKAGITRDVWFYTNELRKVNDKSVAPLKRGFNYLSIVVNDILLKHEEGYNSALVDLEKINSQPTVKSNSTFKEEFNYIKSFFVADINTSTIERSSEKSLSNRNLNEISFFDSNSGFEVQYLRSLYRKPFTSIEVPPIFHTKRTELLSQMILIKIKILNIMKNLCEVNIHSELRDSSLSLPCVVTEGYSDTKDFDMQVLNDLIQCKDILLKQVRSSKLFHLSSHEISDLGKLVFECLVLLSSMTVMKSNNSILNDMYYLHDISRHSTFENEKSFNQNCNSDILPKNITEVLNIPSFNESSTTFIEQLNLFLPQRWMIVTIDIDSSNNLVLSKFSKDCKPFFLRLSLSRFKKRNMGANSCLFDDLVAKLKNIIKESDQSTKSTITSSISTKDDRRNWWKLRFSLDLQLKELLDDIDRFWFGGFKSLFDESSDDSLFCRYKSEFYSTLHKHIPSRKGNREWMHFDDNIVKLFFNIEQFSGEIADDLICFMIDNLKYHGEPNKYSDIDIEKLRNSLEAIHMKYSFLKNPEDSIEHVFLVPSGPCSMIPWESLDFLKKRSISRVPSISLLIEMMKERNHKSSGSLTINGKSDLFYVINPGGDLIRTEQKFKQIFSDVDEWHGIIGERPTEEILLKYLTNNQLFVYLGHGGCEQYIKVSSLFKSCLQKESKLPPSLLIGCSSGSLQHNGLLEPSGNVYNWLTCGSPSVLVNLWDVTDKDIDMFSFSLFAKWGLISATESCINICEATSISRAACALRYLNGAAPVVYGLPLYLKS